MAGGPSLTSRPRATPATKEGSVPAQIEPAPRPGMSKGSVLTGRHFAPTLHIRPRIARSPLREERTMQSIAQPRTEPPTPTAATTPSRLRTVTGSRFLRKCSDG